VVVCSPHDRSQGASPLTVGSSNLSQCLPSCPFHSYQDPGAGSCRDTCLYPFCLMWPGGGLPSKGLHVAQPRVLGLPLTALHLVWVSVPAPRNPWLPCGGEGEPLFPVA